MSIRRTFLTLTAAAMALGAAACGSDLLLGLDAEQGIEGLALRGPLCPVASPDNPCPDEPHQGWIDVWGADGQKVARIRTAADGTFRVGLKPGRYRVAGESGDPFPRGEEKDVTVPEGTWVEVIVGFDTGIR